MSLRWKREKRETGLRAVGAVPRGYVYHNGVKVYATVSASGGGWRRTLECWYWVAGWDSDVPYKNTCHTPCATPEEAKKQAANYVKRYIDKEVTR